MKFDMKEKLKSIEDLLSKNNSSHSDDAENSKFEAQND